ncbi:S9 family peptidase [Janthinobacterium agaricidamnosum]|uniref:Prolyl oligopeptidase family protein n=1 Tax=Janthinobacterium agaricidamnosum NBRC 102515 = DSM 9628 TaxID=1349767 RepID=W0VBS3_9BURK|nr:S9 family peptidase [Janthinobacterium agaricidamnosum]CDG85336.1 prolyl oligopeptidase family protein [Janthinobacterium agaricidamnosum NBRC 102515 = DSM 9628]
MRLVLTLLASLLCAHAALPALAHAATPTPITLDQAMAQPDWIGTPVESAWWGWNGQVFYQQKRSASPLRDIYQVAHGGAKVVGDAQLSKLDGPDVIYNQARTRGILLRNGDLFERDLKSGALTQITRSNNKVSDAQYSADGDAVQFRSGSDWFSWNRAERLVSPVALLVLKKDPDAVPDDDSQRDLQLRLISTLARQKDERDIRRERSRQERRLDPTRAPEPLYLGDKVTLEGSSLSPDGRWLLVVTQDKAGDKGKIGKLARYVTESGYPEGEDERTRVARNMPLPQSLKLVDLQTGKISELSYDVLPGIATDPLAALRAAQKLPALKGNRGVRIDADRDGISWSANGVQVALQIHAIDNKDMWFVGIDLPKASLTPLHRISDEAWVNRRYTDFGWLPDNQTLWYLSEESGYSHLYLRDAAGQTRALTAGSWETSAVQWSADGKTAYFMCNREAPGTYEVCAVPASGGTVRELTSLKGVEDFSVSPDGGKLLLRYSASYLPAQAATVDIKGGKAAILTDTRTPAFKARNWIMPQLVQIPSTHGAAPIWAKLYRPAQLQEGKKYPIVMFAHGAGYLQNVTQRYPVYFREQMFHNLLVEQGYLVLDVDYRASQGYGRAWRTAIYRQMGHPELEDYLDGVQWLAAQHQGDSKNVGIYGGSYGGFMSLMALMRAPDVFKSGAALRPVTDWTTYNHGYTANILNTPDLDPEAYRVSSPIEYADKLKGNLLIAHGMIDDNVFYQDSVRLAQRLIELKKDHWELASYPLERHGFVQPESWYDEFRRIDQLFERTLK